MQGCSAVRLGYNNAPQLAYWWLDGYFDFDRDQSVKVRADLQTLLDWHRKEEVPQIEQQLVRLLALAPQDITPAQVCGVYADLQTRAVAAMEPAVTTMAATAITLQESQLQYLDRAFEKKDREWREEWLEGTAEERAERRLKRAVEWSEWFYGNLATAQIAMLTARFANSQFDPEFQHREKLRRHQDLLATLRGLKAKPLPQAQAALRALVARTVVSADPAYRQHLELLVQENCVTVAMLHNSSTPRQRAKLTKTLQDYQGDAQALANPS
jgi:FMN phosphatase YigB (HAD superfamily)